MMGNTEESSAAGRRRRWRPLLAAASLIALSAGLAGATESAGAAGFTAPTYDMTIGGPGSAFVYPFGEAWDPTTYTQGTTEYHGTLLVDDYNNYDIKRFAADGTWLATYSSKGHASGQFSEQPSGIAVDPTNGDFVVAFAFDGYGYKEFDPNGNWIRTVTVPNQAAWYAPFIAVSPTTGDVYLVQSTGLAKSAPNVVFMFDASGTSLGQFGTDDTGTNTTKACAAGQFGLIRGIDADAAGNVYVNDVSNHCIQEFTGSGTFITSFGNKTDLSANTRGMSIDRTNKVLYVADSAKQEVEAFSIAPGTGFGTLQGTIGTPGGTVGNACGGAGELDGPRDAVAGSDGTVYVSDYTCWTVDAFHPLFDSSSPGGFVQQVPDPAIPPPAGGLNMPVGVAVSPIDDTVYVTDSFNQRIQEFDGPETAGTTAGAFVQMWGSRLPVQSDAFALDYPRGVAIDPNNGHVWVSDTRSGYVKQYTVSGVTPTTAAVTFDTDFGGEGVSPWYLFYSDGIAVGPDGTLYVPDSGYGYFDVISQTGTVEAQFPCGVLAGAPSVFNGCTTATFDSANGYIYAASINQGLVDVFTPTGTLVTTIGTGTLGEPFGVAISGSTLYVTDSKKNRVSEFTIGSGGTGTYLGSFGAKGTANGDLSRPLGIALDAAGDVYVTDYGNDRVEVFKP
jgi:tripartite motif-containing protein 71